MALVPRGLGLRFSLDLEHFLDDGTRQQTLAPSEVVGILRGYLVLLEIIIAEEPALGVGPGDESNVGIGAAGVSAQKVSTYGNRGETGLPFVADKPLLALESSVDDTEDADCLLGVALLGAGDVLVVEVLEPRELAEVGALQQMSVVAMSNPRHRSF